MIRWTVSTCSLVGWWALWAFPNNKEWGEYTRNRFLFRYSFFSFRYSFFSKCLHYGWLPYLFILIEFFILIFFFFFQIFFFFSFRYSFFSKCVHYGWLPYLFILTEFFTLIFFFFLSDILFFQNVYITADYHIYSFW